MAKMTDKQRKAAKDLAQDIADLAAAHINLRRGEVDHPYAAQWLLEEVIECLKEKV